MDYQNRCYTAAIRSRVPWGRGSWVSSSRAPLATCPTQLTISEAHTNICRICGALAALGYADTDSIQNSALVTSGKCLTPYGSSVHVCSVAAICQLPDCFASQAPPGSAHPAMWHSPAQQHSPRIPLSRHTHPTPPNPGLPLTDLRKKMEKTDLSRGLFHFLGIQECISLVE